MPGGKTIDKYTYDHGVRESGVEGNCVFEKFDVLWSENNVEGFDVCVQMLDFAAADDREDIWRFLIEARGTSVFVDFWLEMVQKLTC